MPETTNDKEAKSVGGGEPPNANANTGCGCVTHGQRGDVGGDCDWQHTHNVIVVRFK